MKKYDYQFVHSHMNCADKETYIKNFFVAVFLAGQCFSNASKFSSHDGFKHIKIEYASYQMLA